MNVGIRMKKILSWLKYTFLIFFALFVCAIGWLTINDCGPCLQEQDYAFMQTVKSNLKKVGDRVKLADIHPGDWIKVCATPGGYDDNLAWTPDPDGEGGTASIVLNGSYPYVTDAYDESAIIFYYGKNEDGLEQIEIFRSTPGQGTYEHTVFTDDNCLSREDAYLLWRIHSYYALKSKKEISDE
jgi:hypothetical protein